MRNTHFFLKRSSRFVLAKRSAAGLTDRSNRGFTLVELVVAIAISAVVATLMYSFMDSVLKTKDGHSRAGDELAQLQKAFLLMQRDVEQTVDRPVRDTFGDTQAPVIVSNAQGFELTRIGWSMPPFTRSQRSEVQRVRYEFTEGEIQRTHWITPDITGDLNDRNPVVTSLFKDVESFEVRVAQVVEGTDELSWQSDWPAQQGQGFDPNGNPLPPPALPTLLEVSIEHERFGALRRVFRIVGIGADHTTLPVRPSNQGNNSNNNNGGNDEDDLDEDADEDEQ